MPYAYAKIHNELYLVYKDGKQIGEIDRESDDRMWRITYEGNYISNIAYVNLIDAKKFIENKSLAEYPPEIFEEGC